MKVTSIFQILRQVPGVLGAVKSGRALSAAGKNRAAAAATIAVVVRAAAELFGWSVSDEAVSATVDIAIGLIVWYGVSVQSEDVGPAAAVQPRKWRPRLPEDS